MNYLLRSQFRDVLSRPITTIAILLNLILAVFAVIVIHETSHSLVHQLTLDQPQLAYQYVVPITDKREASYFDLRKRWRAGGIPKVVGMIPVLEGQITVDGSAVPLIGMDPISDLQATEVLGTDPLSSEFFTQDSVVVYGDDLALKKLPSNLKVLKNLLGQQSLLLADIATAQNLLQRTGEVDAVWLRVERAQAWEWLEHLFPGLTTAISVQSPEVVIPDYDVQRMGDWYPAQTFGRSIVFNMGLLGIFAVLVSGFLAYEATVSSVRRRTREFDRLQTIGVSMSRIRLVLIVEFLLLVIIAALIATVLALAFLNHTLPISNVPLNSFLLATSKGWFLGLIAALSGLVFAFIQTSKFQSRLLLITISVLAVLFLSYGMWMSSNLAGAYLSIFAVCLLHTVVLTPTIIYLVNVLVSKCIPESLISRMNLRATGLYLKQAQIAVIAFSLAIGTAIGITLMISSLRADLFAMLDARLPQGVQIRRASEVNPDILKGLPGILDVREYYRGDGNLTIGKTSVVATTLDEFEARRYGYMYDPEKTGLYVNEKLATQSQVRIGDELTLHLASGDPICLPILHIFPSYGEMSRHVIIPVQHFHTQPTTLVRDRLLVVVQPAHLSSVEQQIRELYPTTTVMNNQQIRDRANDIFNKTFALTHLITLIALCVAVIGLFNSALAKQSSKRYEYQLLETLGFSRLELFWQALSQSLLLGGICCLLSLPLGLTIAWLLCEFVNPRAFQWSINLHITPFAVANPLFLSLCVAVLASLLPNFIRYRSVG